MKEMWNEMIKTSINTACKFSIIWLCFSGMIFDRQTNSMVVKNRKQINILAKKEKQILNVADFKGGQTCLWTNNLPAFADYLTSCCFFPIMRILKLRHLYKCELEIFSEHIKSLHILTILIEATVWHVTLIISKANLLYFMQTAVHRMVDFCYERPTSPCFSRITTRERQQPGDDDKQESEWSRV